MEIIKTILELHIIAFGLGFILDLIIGDPHWIYHPVRAIGFLISICDKALRKDKDKENPGKQIFGGVVTVLVVLLMTKLVAAGVLLGCFYINIYLGMAMEAIMTYFILATRSLASESMKVSKALENGTIDDARKAVSMIVGRDTEVLDEEGVIKAAVETVAENTSDGIIAPMIYTFLGGPVLGFMYKAVNTMDSMIGYKNDKYLYFGRPAAKLDDIVNFFPARISAVLMIIASFIGGKDYSAKDAIRIFKRDRFNHKSPNSAQTESVCAGALGVRLAGNASYFGKVVEKPYIGDATRAIERKNIKRACRLMFITAFLCMFICEAIMALIWVLL